MTLRNAIIATIAYADVFDYPLLREEVIRWLVKTSRNNKSQLVISAKEGIQRFDNFFFLERRRHIVVIRKKRRRWVGEKMQVAKRAAILLKFIPTIQFVGITGALAMDNAHKDDDIDFYIVTATGTLWTTRFFVTVLLALFGLRRKPGDTSFCNKICLNMYVDELHLAVDINEQDLFSAHEVLQMKPLWERNGIYNKFLKVNQWVKHFLPNAWDDVKQETRNKKYETAESNFFSWIFIISHVSCYIFEPLVRSLQLWYMHRHRTTEVVSGSVIRFHPHDARIWIRSKLAGRLAKQKIPLDKIFFAR